MLQLGTPQAAKNGLQVAVVVWQGGICSPNSRPWGYGIPLTANGHDLISSHRSFRSGSQTNRLREHFLIVCEMDVH